MSKQDSLNKAMQLHNAGEYSAAIALYLALLKDNPEDANILNPLGVAYIQQGKPELAEPYLLKATSQAKPSADYFYNHGLCLAQLGRLNEAVDAYQKAIELKPSYPAALSNLANLRRDMGQFHEALEGYAAALSIDSKYALAFFNRGVLYERLEQLTAAQQDYQAALKFNPLLHDARCNEANLQTRLGNTKAAEAGYRKIIENEPNYLPAYINLGQLYQKKRKYAQAQDLYKKALEFNPTALPPLQGLANTAIEKRDFNEAHSIAQEIIRHYPKIPTGYIIKAEAELGLGDYLAAIRALEMARIIVPNQSEVLDKLGFAWLSYGNQRNALYYFRLALKQQPNFLNAQWHLANALLREGLYTEGLSLYETRFAMEYLHKPTPARSLSGSAWKNKQSLNGKRLFITHDTSLDLVILALRFIPTIKAQGAILSGETEAGLLPCLQRLKLFDALMDEKKRATPGLDYYCPWFSLTLALQTTLENLPHKIPYINADPHLTVQWQKKLKELPSLRLGITWRSLQSNQLIHEDLPNLSDLLSCVPSEYQLICLETDLTQEEQDCLAAHGNVHCLLQPSASLEQQLALCQAIDGVVGANTLLMHLCGALGRPGWVLLSSNPAWYYGSQETSNPWYPTLNLFRQQPGEDWQFAKTALSEALVALQNITSTSYSKIQEDITNKKFYNASSMLEPLLRLHPQADNLLNLAGRIAEATGEFKTAVTYFKQAIQQKDNEPIYYFNLGASYDGLNYHKSALAAYHKSIEINPNFYYSYSNMAADSAKIRRYHDSLKYIDLLIRFLPYDANSKFTKSLLLLTLGRYQEGWYLYEQRENINTFFPRQQLSPKLFARPRWQGQQELTNKWLVVVYEQGFGDMIMFARYLVELKKRGAKILVIMFQQLTTLFKSMPCVDRVLGPADDLPDFDYWCPIGSLPHAFKTLPHTIPTPMPYLFADKNKTHHWQKLLSGCDKKKIGIIWRGREDNIERALRKIPLNALLASLPEQFNYISLQNDILPNEIKLLEGANVAHFEQYLHDFSDTAALIEQLDLVISIDTAVAHLAGAMHKETWVLLNYSPDWRWFPSGEHSPWYPAVRLFRQKRFNHWESVLKTVGLALEEWASKPGTAKLPSRH